MRRAGGAGRHERHAAIVVGHGREPVERRRDERTVARVELVEQVERREHRDRLAVRGADVGLERLPEAAVLVRVRRERAQHGVARAVTEQMSEMRPVEEPGVEEDEGAGGVEVDHGPSVTARPAHGLNETDPRASW